MYSTRPGLILGFHGTDKSVAFDVLNGKTHLLPQKNDYDWLGHGLYFWEYSPDRALDFAKLLKQNPSRTKRKIMEPYVIGAVISLGKCLDFTDYKNLSLLKKGYELVKKTVAENEMPENKTAGGSKDLLLRKLDCLVIETLHKAFKEESNEEFDSVRGVFWEGDEIYPTAGFKEKNHIQICIRNPNCIKGYFLPRDIDRNYRLV